MPKDLKKNQPEHIAIIMDGNRRWAKERGLPTLVGHRHGYEAVRRAMEYCLKRGVGVLTVWAFSTDNWNRSKKEVGYLMRLLRNMLRHDVKTFIRENVRFNFIGRLNDLPKELRQEIKKAVEKTKSNTRAVFNAAINYGGRPEIIDTIKGIVADKIPKNKITEKLVDKYLYTKNLPDPDLIIRTSGEQRLSGFLPWQGAYAELYFSEKYWPDFDEAEFDKALNEFSRRQRRFGR